MQAPLATPRSRPCILALMERLRAMPDAEYLQYLVAYHAAPTVQGIKPATLICPGACGRNLEQALADCGSRMASSLGVEIANLRNRAGALLLLIYNPGLLRSALAEEEVAELLNESGYSAPAADVAELLAHLRNKCAGRCFPHEIGVLLGYPPGDVRLFMSGAAGARQAVAAWKSYTDAGTAEKRSARYRFAKLRAAELIMGGSDPGDIAVKLRIGA